jgi:hypothetical protein
VRALLRRHDLERGRLRVSWRLMLIPWRACRERSRWKAVVTHGKAWAGSQSRLKGRASPTRKGAGLRTPRTGMEAGSCNCGAEEEMPWPPAGTLYAAQLGANEGSQMPRHLISDAHEWINEIPTVPIYYLAKPQPRERAWKKQRGKKTLLSLTLVRLCEMT